MNVFKMSIPYNYFIDTPLPPVGIPSYIPPPYPSIWAHDVFREFFFLKFLTLCLGMSNGEKKFR